MKKIVSLILSLTLLLSSLAILSSCGAKDAGAEISVYLGERIYDFDPTDYYVDSNAESVLSLLFEPLFSVNSKGKLEYAAAKKYTVDESTRTIVITLRETYWSDGVPVKAEDYIHAWSNILLNPNDANPAAVLLYDIKNAAEIKNGSVASVFDFGAVATGTQEITINYRKGANVDMLLKNLASIATSPIRQDIATDHTSGYWSKLLNSAISNGPFMLGTLDEDENNFTLVRNTGYHQSPTAKDVTKNVTPAKLVSVFTRFGETELTYADIENKAVFYMSDASLAERAAKKGSATVSDDLSTYTYVFNTKNELFKIKEVREALSKVIDRNAIIDAITFGKAATGFLPDSVIDTNTGKKFRTENLISTSADLNAAKALLDGVDLSGVKTEFTLTVNDDEESVAIANLVKAAWESLGHGIKVTVKPVGYIKTTPTEGIQALDSEIQVLVNRASRGDIAFDVIAVDWQMYSTDAFVPLAAFSTEYSGSGVKLPYLDKYYGSFGGYTNAEYDDLIKSAYKESDTAKRSELLHSAEKALVESYAVVPLVYNQNFAFVSRDLSGLTTNGFGDFVFTKVKQKNYRNYLED
ncbi:MAG: hypothetical protein IJY18_00800 [Clostridia bacterium]|nr:hypothetical protein [Clostridia bacterium]